MHQGWSPDPGKSIEPPSLGIWHGAEKEGSLSSDLGTLRQSSFAHLVLRAAERVGVLRREEIGDQTTKRGSSRHSTLRFQAFLRLVTFLLSEFTKHPHGCKTNSPFLQVGSGVPVTILNLCTHPVSCRNSNVWPSFWVYLSILRETQIKPNSKIYWALETGVCTGPQDHLTPFRERQKDGRAC